jgi:hypothetical protein
MGMNEFPPPNRLSRLAKRITVSDAKDYGVDMVDPSLPRGIDGDYVYRDPGSPDSAPPSNWPTVAQTMAPMPRKIKGTIRGGAGAGRGDVPYYMDSDPTPPYGIKRPKL